LLIAVAAIGQPAPGGRPKFSWDTLPVFFHSCNTSGPWSDAAVHQIARFPMATFEKSHAMKLPDGGQQSEEIAGPQACDQVSAEKSGTDTFFYLNSVIDWPFNFNLHQQMVDKPEWRLKNSTGGDVMAFPANRGIIWCYNLTNPDMRAYWVNECVEAVKKGCTGCFIDQANVAEGVAGWPAGSPVVAAYAKAHMLAQTELAEALKPTDNYAIYNHLGNANYSTTAMMIEDFVGTDKCVRRLQTIASRGLAIEAHVGDLPKSAKWGGVGKGNQCIDGDTNSLAAFLIGAGKYSYYHCSYDPETWNSDPKWPAVADAWLDWLPIYDMPLGAPDGLAKEEPSPTTQGATLYTRTFATGTKVAFDGGTANGTIWWSHGVTHVGPKANLTGIAAGCNWESMFDGITLE